MGRLAVAHRDGAEWIWLLFRPESVYGEPDRFRSRTRSAWGSSDRFSRSCSNVGVAIVLASAVAAVVSLVVRFRRAGEERQQITWLLLVAIVAALLMLTMFVGGPPRRSRDSTSCGSRSCWCSGSRARRPSRSSGTGSTTSTSSSRRRSPTWVWRWGSCSLRRDRTRRALIGDESDPALRLGAAILVASPCSRLGRLFTRLANRLVYGGRSTPYQVMAEFGDRIAQIPSVDELLPDMAEAAGRGVGARAARVRMFLPGPEGTDRVRSATWPAEPTWASRTSILPIEHAGEPIGDLAVAKPSGDPLRPTDARCSRTSRARRDRTRERAALGRPGAAGGELSAQTEELRRSRERLVTVRDAQRRRLEQELRDGVGAEIAGGPGRDPRRRGTCRRDPDDVRASLEQLSERATVALDDLREVARGSSRRCSPTRARVALGALARRAATGRSSILGGAPDTRYDAAVEAAIYFCCVQALQNAERHAPGRRVDLTLAHEPGEVSFSVHDRGAGFDIDRVDGGEGLQIMRDRMAAPAARSRSRARRGHRDDGDRHAAGARPETVGTESDRRRAIAIRSSC